MPDRCDKHFDSRRKRALRTNSARCLIQAAFWIGPASWITRFGT